MVRPYRRVGVQASLAKLDCGRLVVVIDGNWDGDRSRCGPASPEALVRAPNNGPFPKVPPRTVSPCIRLFGDPRPELK